jgi:hypothetical protein
MATADTNTDDHDSALGSSDLVDSPEWSPFTRIAVRFCVVYFVAFCVFFPQILFALTDSSASSCHPTR